MAAGKLMLELRFASRRDRLDGLIEPEPQRLRKLGPIDVVECVAEKPVFVERDSRLSGNPEDAGRRAVV